MVCHPCISPWTHDAAPDFRHRKVITDLGDVQFSLSMLANTSPMQSPLLAEFHLEQFLSSKEVMLTASPGEKDDTWARCFMRNFGPFLLGTWNTLKVRGNTVVMESLKSTKTVINKYETYIAIFLCKCYCISTQNTQQHLEEPCGGVGNVLLKLCTTMVQKLLSSHTCCPTQVSLCDRQVCLHWESKKLTYLEFYPPEGQNTEHGLWTEKQQWTYIPGKPCGGQRFSTLPDRNGLGSDPQWFIHLLSEIFH